MEKIIILKINESGDVSIMNKTEVKLSKSVLEEIADTYKKLNIPEKKKILVETIMKYLDTIIVKNLHWILIVMLMYKEF